MNCFRDLRVLTVPNYVWPLNYNATLRPDLHEGMGIIAHGLKIECFGPTIRFNVQSHKICYFYELNLSHVNLFGPSTSPKSYLISFLLSSSFLSHYLCKSFNLCFLFHSHLLTLFFFIFFNIFFQLTFFTLTSFQFLYFLSFYSFLI
jgi:hypothetical protein